jgi:hypothetical protein
MHFTTTDEADLAKRGLQVADLVNLIYRFTQHTLPIALERPCTAGDGIVVLNSSQSLRYLDYFEKESPKRTMIKFVPASGAASRMFKHLYTYTPENVSSLTEEFIINFDLFPFFHTLKISLQRQGISLEDLIETNAWEKIFNYILFEPGLGYSRFPKGLVPFHRYPFEIRTAFEEHIHEAIDYGREKDGTCRLHFTLAPHQIDDVMKFLNDRVKAFPYENFILQHSLQEEKTDTPALDKDNLPVRDSDGRILFRPAGHGALISNLESLDADIIFIKNIDNVTTSDQKTESIIYKKILAGLLLFLKTETDKHLQQLRDDTPGAIAGAIEFIQSWFQPGAPIGLNEEQLKMFVINHLDRPIRVCGMVRNEGEPGGGPFWVKSKEGLLSKQIVEKSQVDLHDLNQSKILSGSTHFNPVDIVCAIRKSNGSKYHLDDFIDHSTGFISEKFQDGKVIKALELPGLWNGAMALWNTVFVEVPNSTFNPVKTVNDLLRPGHQVA